MKSIFIDGRGIDSNLTYRSLSKISDIFEYLEHGLIDNLYWSQRFGKNTGQSHILYQNILLGVPLLRQVRVRNGSCKIYDHFRYRIKECYAPYEAKFEDTECLGPGMLSAKTSAVKICRNYTDGKQLGNLAYWGYFGTYGGGGYCQDLSRNWNESLRILKDLKKDFWIDKATRAVFVDFTIFNANVNLFSVIRLIMELPASGGVYPFWKIKITNLAKLNGKNKATWCILFVIYAIILFIIIINESIKIFYEKSKYFKSLWRCIDFVSYGGSLVYLGFEVYSIFHNKLDLRDISSSHIDSINFERMATINEHFLKLFSVVVFCAWIKLFEYFQFTTSFKQLSLILKRSTIGIIKFSTIFIIIFTSFAVLGFLIFGTQLKDFKSFGNSFFTQFRIILGDFKFYQLEKTNRILGPVYFIGFVFFVFFILLNMFLAILNDTYTEVKKECVNDNNSFDFLHQLRNKFNFVILNFKAKLFPHKFKIKNKENKLQENIPLTPVEMPSKISEISEKVTQQEVKDLISKIDLLEDLIEMLFERTDSFLSCLNESSLND